MSLTDFLDRYRYDIAWRRNLADDNDGRDYSCTANVRYAFDPTVEPRSAPFYGADETPFLLTKPRPKIVGRTCQQTDFVCKRPQWGDGRVNGDFHGLCSMCWHAWNAWHGKYITMRANPAAALLGSTSVETLRFLTGNELPDAPEKEITSVTFPAEWLT